MNSAADQEKMNDLESYLEHPTTKAIRDTLTDAATALHDSDPVAPSPSSNPDLWDWGGYHNPDRDALYAQAFPPGTPDRADLIQRADKMIDDESELEGIEGPGWRCLDEPALVQPVRRTTVGGGHQRGAR